MTRYYLAEFEKQLTGSPLQSVNCGAASGAMLADQATLGLKDPSPDRFRRLTGDVEGGLMMGAILTAMEELGIPVTAYDNDDRLKWVDLKAMIAKGRFAVVAGDYDVIPLKYRGDKDYEGFHAVFYHAILGDEIRVGDPLNDGRRQGIPQGYIRWPLEVAATYVKRFDEQVTGGIHAVVMDIRKITPKTRVANVRSAPERGDNLLGRLQFGRSILYGGTEKGEPVNGNSTWFRVWYPRRGCVGFIHSSVMRRI